MTVWSILCWGCACPGGGSVCDTGCTDLLSDPANCGACGYTCTGLEVCTNGFCVCEEGCGSACTDPSRDPNNCGVCGRRCASGAACLSGRCTCPAGLADCGTRCASLDESPDCGACGNVCDPSQECVDAGCACPAERPLSCGESCVDPQADDDHCGDCSTVCLGDTSCVRGVCQCPFSDLTSCGGACVDLTTSPEHCGECGAYCVEPRACFDGDCNCGVGRTLCGATCTSLETSVAHCGGCGVACAVGAACEAGHCSPSLLWNTRVAGGTTGDSVFLLEDGRVALRDGVMVRAHGSRYGNTFIAAHDVASGAESWRRTAATFAARVGAVAVSEDGRIAIVASFDSRWTSPGGTPYNLPAGIVGGVVVMVLDAGGNLLFDHFVPGNGDAGGVAFLSTGELVASGSFEGAIDFGGTLLSAGSDGDLFVAVFDRSGVVVRARDFGRGGGEEPTYLAVTDDDELLLAGHSGAGIDFGGGVLASSNIRWAARLDSHFAHRWSRIVQASRLDGLAATHTGVTLISGVASAGDFGSGVAIPAGERFLVALDPIGHALWGTSEATASSYRSGGIAVDEEDRIYSLSSYSSGAPAPFPVSTSLAITAYSSSGRRLSFRAFGAPLGTPLLGTGVAASGGYLGLALHVDSAIDLGLGSLPRIDAGDIVYATFSR